MATSAWHVALIVLTPKQLFCSPHLIMHEMKMNVCRSVSSRAFFPGACMGRVSLSGTPGLQRPEGDVHRDQRDSGGFRIPTPVLINTYFLI